MVYKTKIAIGFIILSCLLLVSCDRGKKNLPVVAIDKASIPTMYSENVSMLISDSGITRYGLNANIWEMYSNAVEPYWYFPEKIHVERFDSLFNIDFSIDADTAYFYEKKELWHVIGNVFIKNLQGDTFETSELFWDQKADTNSINSIYTDKFIKVNRGDRLLTGYGLRSNQSMTNYRVYDSTAEAVIKENEENERNEGNEGNEENEKNEEIPIDTIETKKDTERLMDSREIDKR